MPVKPAPYTSPIRNYRTRCTPRSEEYAFQVRVAETDVRITLATSQIHTPETMVQFATKEIQEQRNNLQMWCALYPAFQHALTPITLPKSIQIPEIIRQMTDATALVGVGPFAAVAGAMAYFIATRLSPLSPECIVENGGDIYLQGKTKRVVALLADPTNDASIGIEIEADTLPTSICASSATIGHSISFGVGELAVVRAPNASLADAFATDCGNRLQNAASINKIIERAKTLQEHGIEGVFLQCDGKIGVWGAMPLVAIAK